jgi:methyl-accepting chemotaxis protein
MAFVSKNDNSVAINTNGSTTTSADKRRSRTLAKQQQISEGIASISTQILDNAQESVSIAKKLQSLIKQTTTAIEKNSSASKQALENVKIITKNIKRMTSSINTVVQSTLSTGNIITSSVDNVDLTVMRMQNTISVAKNASTKSEELKLSSQSIGSVVGLIAKIADQTNLLALNAAIEASRAKEHGKGFAVVADETHLLAGESEKNAEHISAMVSTIQMSIDNITNFIVNTTNIIGNTGKTGESLSKKMGELKKISVYTVEATKSINIHIEKLHDNSTLILDGSKNITDATSNIALLVDQTMNDVEFQTNTLIEAQEDIKELSHLADDLKYSTNSIETAEDIINLADQISSSTEDVQLHLSQVNLSLDDIKQQSNVTNKTTLNIKKYLEDVLSNAMDIDSLILISRRNFDILKISFTEAKHILLNIKLDIEKSVVQGQSGNLELSVTTKEIKNVNKTVSNISKSIVQLKMLAISGSIESARAGNFGKGFAVVSNDIRNLSKDLETNTDTICDIVESMNIEINTAQNHWLALLQGQNNENKNLDSVIIEIDTINEQLLDLLDEFQSLKTVNSKNIDNIKSVLTSTTEIQKAVEVSVKNAIESKEVGELLAETILSITDGVEELAIIADELQQG